MSAPCARPTPDILYPPNGASVWTLELQLTESTPVRTARAIRIARPMSRVQIDPDRPYGLSFASRTASSSVSKGMIATTGPKISSRAIRMPEVTESKTVSWI